MPNAIYAMLAVISLTLGCSECETDYDCPNAQICNNSVGLCEALTCRVQKDCRPGYSCKDNKCVQTSQSTNAEPGETLQLGQ
ncbi:MAG: hypothetical protein ACON3Z_13390 [Bradymonadia bacterium]